jgi:3-oxoacyl-[acyl-carrier-protein] synthase-3
MTAAYLDQMAFALGEQRCHLDQTAAQGRLRSPASDLAAAGFRWHHRCGPETSGYDLAHRAVADLAERGALDGIDALVYATCLTRNGNLGSDADFECTGDVKFLMDYPASRLQAAFGLDGAVVVGLNQQACTSLIGSLRLAAALLASEPQWDRVLCVTADRFPEGATYEQAYNLISDGAAACVVSRRPGAFQLVSTHQITNGALAQASDDETVGVYFSFTHRLVTETLAKAGLGAAAVDWVIPQNTNRHTWQVMGPMVGIDVAKVWSPTLAEVGHVISADNVVNLTALLEAGTVRPGQWLLLVMAGFGLNWQGAVLWATEEVGR